MSYTPIPVPTYPEQPVPPPPPFKKPNFKLLGLGSIILMGVAFVLGYILLGNRYNQTSKQGRNGISVSPTPQKTYESFTYPTLYPTTDPKYRMWIPLTSGEHLNDTEISVTFPKEALVMYEKNINSKGFVTYALNSNISNGGDWDCCGQITITVLPNAQTIDEWLFLIAKINKDTVTVEQKDNTGSRPTYTISENEQYTGGAIYTVILGNKNSYKVDTNDQVAGSVGIQRTISYLRIE